MSEQDSYQNELNLMEALADTPETTQASLAAQVGVAVGTVNWYLKRWTAKGYVKVRRIDRWRWHYLLTPEGISHKATLARKYVDASMKLYRRTRIEARLLLEEVRAAGHEQVVIEGDGEIAEICRLTCLEMGVEVISVDDRAHQQSSTPVVRVEEMTLTIDMPERKQTLDDRN